MTRQFLYRLRLQHGLSLAVSPFFLPRTTWADIAFLGLTFKEKKRKQQQPNVLMILVDARNYFLSWFRVHVHVTSSNVSHFKRRQGNLFFKIKHL